MNQPVLRLRGFQAYGMDVEMIRPMCAHPGLESIRLSSVPLYLNGRTELSGLPLNLKEPQVMDYVVNEMSLTEVLSRCKKLQSLILPRQNLDNVDLAKVVLVLRRDGRNLKTLVLCVYPVSPPLGWVSSLAKLDRSVSSIDWGVSVLTIASFNAGTCKMQTARLPALLWCNCYQRL